MSFPHQSINKTVLERRKLGWTDFFFLSVKHLKIFNHQLVTAGEFVFQILSSGVCLKLRKSNENNSEKNSLYELSGGCDFEAVCPDEHFGASQRANRKANKHSNVYLI